VRITQLVGFRDPNARKHEEAASAAALLASAAWTKLCWMIEKISSARSARSRSKSTRSWNAPMSWMRKLANPSYWKCETKVWWNSIFTKGDGSSHDPVKWSYDFVEAQTHKGPQAPAHDVDRRVYSLAAAERREGALSPGADRAVARRSMHGTLHHRSGA